MPLAPQFDRPNAPYDSHDSETIELANLPPLFLRSSPASCAVTPPPVSNLARSSVASSHSDGVEKVVMPQPGDAFFGFRLVEELGHGAFARVFLAKLHRMPNLCIRRAPQLPGS